MMGFPDAFAVSWRLAKVQKLITGDLDIIMCEIRLMLWPMSFGAVVFSNEATSFRPSGIGKYLCLVFPC